MIAAALLLFVGFEWFAVARARARTPSIIAETAHRELRLGDVGGRRLRMLLRVEDPGFFTHHGVDWSTPGQGMTTLTQGLVKRLYFDGGFKPGFAKIEQSLIARFVFDPAVSKRDQLEISLNWASFGNFHGRPVIGFDAAARTYYGVPFAGLNDRQFVGLVAMLMAPNALDPVRHPRENAERVARIEMLLAGKCVPRGLRDVSYRDCGAPLNS
jgi:membrane carboxypeptidase/penicillin-binding protein